MSIPFLCCNGADRATDRTRRNPVKAIQLKPRPPTVQGACVTKTPSERRESIRPISFAVIVYLNGEFLPSERASVNVLDRGFLLGDGVYEGLRAFVGRAHSINRHTQRMREGLAEAKIDWNPGAMGDLTHRLLDAAGLRDAFIYWQVTRGTPAPGHPARTRVPAGPLTPTVLGFCSPQPSIDAYTTPPTIHAATVPDTRWSRGRLKSISMLGNVLSAMEAADQGAREAIMVRDGLVSEACACNVILAVPGRDGHTELVTPSLQSVPILAGVTRQIVLEVDRTIVERPVHARELEQASEIILVGTTSLVTSVTMLDGRPISGGAPGPHATRLLQAYLDYVRADLGFPMGLRAGAA